MAFSYSEAQRADVEKRRGRKVVNFMVIVVDGVGVFFGVRVGVVAEGNRLCFTARLYGGWTIGK
jgi:hypothetical protein